LGSPFLPPQAAGPYTGGAFNPARYIANVGAGCHLDGTAGFYIAGHFLAAAIVLGLIYARRYSTPSSDVFHRYELLEEKPGGKKDS